MAKRSPPYRIGIVKYDNPSSSLLKKGEIVETTEYYGLYKRLGKNYRQWYLDKEDIDFREFTALEKLIYGIK